MKLTMGDVWGSDNSKGMIVAESGEKCPVFKDKVPYKSVTVVCNKDDEEEVCYWLDYVHGGGISKIAKSKDGKLAIRSNYMC